MSTPSRLVDNPDLKVDDDTVVTDPDKGKSEFTIPEKFEGKSAVEIAESFVNLEQELGRKNNEVGELRKLSDAFLKQQVDASAIKQEPAARPELNSDSLWDDPASAIDGAVETNPKILALEKKLEEQATVNAQRQFEVNHPKYQEISKTPEFEEWVAKSNVRVGLYQKAHAFDFGAANDLFDLYNEVQEMIAEKQVESETKRKKVLKDGTTERGSSGESSAKIYRRSDLIKLKMTDPDKYDARADEIMKAYAEGRVR